MKRGGFLSGPSLVGVAKMIGAFAVGALLLGLAFALGAGLSLSEAIGVAWALTVAVVGLFVLGYVAIQAIIWLAARLQR